MVHIDQAVLTRATRPSDSEQHACELDEGPALALDTARRLARDATLVGLVEGEDGEPLDIGRKTRAIPAALDRTRFTHSHHVKHWADGGHTKLRNLVSLCRFHHMLVTKAASA